MKRILLTLVPIVVLCNLASSQSYFVKNESNPRDGSTIVYMANNYIAPELQLSAGIVETRSGNRRHILASHYTGYDRFSGHTLYLYIDGEEITLNRIVNQQRRGNHEIVGFDISSEILGKLGNASTVRIHFRGNWSIEREIDREHIRRFGEFYSQHIR